MTTVVLPFLYMRKLLFSGRTSVYEQLLSQPGHIYNKTGELYKFYTLVEVCLLFEAAHWGILLP